MKFPNLILISLFVLLLTGCGKDDPITPPKEKEDPIALAPRITTLSREYVVAGNELTVSGSDFNQLGFETKIYVNSEELTPTSLTDEEVTVDIDTEKGGPSNIIVEVDGRKSAAAFFYILNKGWNKLVLDRERRFKKAIVLDDDDDIYVMGDLQSGSSVWFNNLVFKLTPSSENFKEQAIPDIMNGGLVNFEIDSTGKAAVTNGYTLQLFENKFDAEKNKYLAAALQDPGSGQYMSILLDGNEVFYSNYMFTFGYSADFGNSYEKGHIDWLSSPTSGGNSYYGGITSIKKAPSDNKIYGIGTYRKGWKYGNTATNLDTNIIMRSDDYVNWEVLDTVTVNTERTLERAKFFDTDLILTTDAEKNLLLSSDLAKTWSTVRQGINRFYLRTKNEWYAVTSENKVISTIDAGQTWTTELEFEETDAITRINFSKNKVVISGYGFIYVKYE